jgi:hypothetical protein
VGFGWKKWKETRDLKTLKPILFLDWDSQETRRSYLVSFVAPWSCGHSQVSLGSSADISFDPKTCRFCHQFPKISHG